MSTKTVTPLAAVAAPTHHTADRTAARLTEAQSKVIAMLGAIYCIRRLAEDAQSTDEDTVEAIARSLRLLGDEAERLCVWLDPEQLLEADRHDLDLPRNAAKGS